MASSTLRNNGRARRETASSQADHPRLGTRRTPRKQTPAANPELVMLILRCQTCCSISVGSSKETTGFIAQAPCYIDEGAILRRRCRHGYGACGVDCRGAARTTLGGRRELEVAFASEQIDACATQACDGSQRQGCEDSGKQRDEMRQPWRGCWISSGRKSNSTQTDWKPSPQSPVQWAAGFRACPNPQVTARCDDFCRDLGGEPTRTSYSSTIKSG